MLRSQHQALLFLAGAADFSNVLSCAKRDVYLLFENSAHFHFTARCKWFGMRADECHMEFPRLRVFVFVRYGVAGGRRRKSRLVESALRAVCVLLRISKHRYFRAIIWTPWDLGFFRDRELRLRVICRAIPCPSLPSSSRTRLL